MRKITIIVAVALVVVLGTATIVMAADPNPPSNETLQQMWQACHGGAGGAGLGMSGPAANQVAKLIGVSSEDLLAERNAGKSIFQIAAAKGLSEQQVIDAALAPHRDSLAVRVKYGYITEQQSAQLLQQQQETLRTVFSATGPIGNGGFGGRGMMGGYGGFGGMMGGYGPAGSSNDSNSGGYRGGGMMGGFGGMMGGRF